MGPVHGKTGASLRCRRSARAGTKLAEAPPMGRTVYWGMTLAAGLAAACGGRVDIDADAPLEGWVASDGSVGASGAAGAQTGTAAIGEAGGQTGEQNANEEAEGSAVTLDEFFRTDPEDQLLAEIARRAAPATTTAQPPIGLAQPSAPSLPHCEGSCSGCSSELDVCYIQCIGDGTCTQADLTCPEGWPCVVVCAGRNTCGQADVQCPPGYRCSLECSGDLSCTQLRLECEGDLCELACSGSHACTQLHRP